MPIPCRRRSKVGGRSEKRAGALSLSKRAVNGPGAPVRAGALRAPARGANGLRRAQGAWPRPPFNPRSRAVALDRWARTDILNV